MKANKIKWIASVCVFTAAISITVREENALYVWPFVLYAIGSFCWMIAGFKTKDMPLILLNMFFVVVNVYGISIRV